MSSPNPYQSASSALTPKPTESNSVSKRSNASVGCLIPLGFGLLISFVFAFAALTLHDSRFFVVEHWEKFTSAGGDSYHPAVSAWFRIGLLDHLFSIAVFGVLLVQFSRSSKHFQKTFFWAACIKILLVVCRCLNAMRFDGNPPLAMSLGDMVFTFLITPIFLITYVVYLRRKNITFARGKSVEVSILFPETTEEDTYHDFFTTLETSLEQSSAGKIVRQVTGQGFWAIDVELANATGVEALRTSLSALGAPRGTIIEHPGGEVKI